MIHINEGLLNDEGHIDPDKIDLVGRLGGDYYVRTSGEAKFVVQKPLAKKGIGVDSLPESIRISKYLTGNDLGQLGNLKKLPSEEDITAFKKLEGKGVHLLSEVEIQKKAKILIEQGKAEQALLLLIAAIT